MSVVTVYEMINDNPKNLKMVFIKYVNSSHEAPQSAECPMFYHSCSAKGSHFQVILIICRGIFNLVKVSGNLFITLQGK